MNTTSLFFDAFTQVGPNHQAHPQQPWSLEQLVDEMHHCSISAALVATTGQMWYDSMIENRKLAKRLEGYDFLFPIWTVQPHWLNDFPEPAEMTRMLADHDVRAVVARLKTGGWSILSQFSRPLWNELESTRTLTILDFRELAPNELEQFLAQHPNLPILLRGISWGQARYVVPLLRHFENLHVGFDSFQVNYGIEWLTNLGLEDQLIFCSNAPEMSLGAHRCYVDYAQVPAATRDKIASGNLIRLLKGLRPPREIVNSNEDAIMAEARHGKPLSPLVLDMHAHILDEGLNGAGGGASMYRGGPEGTYQLARRLGVDGIGVMSWNGTVGVHASEGNQCVQDALDARPEFFWGLATFDVVHQSAEQMRRSMEQVFQDSRFLGLKPYPHYGIPYDDRRYDCWWEFGNARRLYCGLHPVKWWQPQEFDHICSKYPNLTVVGYHCGASYTVADVAIELARKHPNFMIEITFTSVCSGIVEYLVRGAGADRVMYGSDLPMRDPRQQLGWVAYSKLTLDEKKKVLGLNARRLIRSIRTANRSARCRSKWSWLDSDDIPNDGVASPLA